MQATSPATAAISARAALPARAAFVIIGAGIHGLSTAWHLAMARGRGDDILVVDKTGIGAGASGIACGVVRNNYFQSPMRELMAHSVAVWESDPAAFAYHGVGYLQISPASMRAGIEKIHDEQRAIGYESTLIGGGKEADAYMKSIFHDWQAAGVDSVLHEKRGGFANNIASVRGLAAKAEALGVRIVSGATVTGFARESGSPAVRAVVTDKGTIECEQVIVAAGPWVRTFWDLLDLPAAIEIKRDNETRRAPMWRYWALQEGVLDVPLDYLRANDGNPAPVAHLDSDEPLFADGAKIADKWGIYYKADPYFNGVQGGAAPYKVDRPAGEVEVDPYGPKSPEFTVGDGFAAMWTAALAFAHKRFEGKAGLFRKEPSGGIGCFTVDSFPVFDRFCENAYFIADSNHGYKMIGVGALVAAELLGGEERLLAPFRFARFAAGDLLETSNSPFPWS